MTFWRRVLRPGFAVGVAATVLALFGYSAAATPLRQSPPSATQAQAVATPIAAAWLYMSDDQNYNQIPAYWSEINFANVDVLFVGPAGVQADGTFGLYKSSQTGDLANRFRWVIGTARQQNPAVKIVISQWWGTGTGIWGKPLSTLKTNSAIQKYATSVGTFLNSYLGIAGGVDGYDIDYESNNVTKNTASITSKVRAQLTNLSQANGGRPFYQTVSPATTSYLSNAVPYLDLVNMQTYAGGSGLTPQNFLALGFQSNQLLYGICPETNCPSPSLATAESQYTNNNLAGIHLWRLNSDNYVYEGQVQAQVYQFLHPQFAMANGIWEPLFTGLLSRTSVNPRTTVAAR